MKKTLVYMGFALCCLSGCLAALQGAWSAPTFAFAGGVFALTGFEWKRR